MFSWIKKRLEWKLLAYFLVFMAVFSAVMGGGTYYNAEKRRSSEMLLYDTHGRTLIRSFARDVMFGLLSQDTKTMAGRVDLLFKDPTVSYALIYNNKGEPAYARYRQNIKPKSLKLPKPSSGAAAGVSAGSLRSSSGIEFLDLTAPVGESEGGAADPGGASSIGWVRIGMSLEAPNREIRASWLVNLLLILVVVAGGVAFIYFSIRMIMAPVERLAGAARRVGEGEFGIQVEVTSEDQVGLLTGTFNRMSVNIKKMVELEASYRELQEVDKMKDNLLHMVSHDLRTPMTGILGYAEILHDNMEDYSPEQRRNFLGIIIRESQRLTRLINDLLDLQRFESGSVALDMIELDLAALVREASEVFKSAAGQKHLELVFQFNRPEVKVTGDWDRLNQVVANLLSNAVKFTPEGGRIAITVDIISRDGGPGLARVEVADTGPGIPDELRPRLFDKFQQAHKGQRAKNEGSGLGLALVREIIQHHKGEAGVESQPGQGSRFFFCLPALGD